jgi:thioredoxin reductase (NADPH)
MKKIQVYGADWCGSCLRAKMFLDTKGIAYENIDVDKIEDAAELVMKINNGKRIIPTILIDGVPHTNPNNQELAEILELN